MVTLEQTSATNTPSLGDHQETVWSHKQQDVDHRENQHVSASTATADTTPVSPINGDGNGNGNGIDDGNRNGNNSGTVVEGTPRPSNLNQQQQQQQRNDELLACRCDSANAIVTLLNCLKGVGVRGVELAGGLQSSQHASQHDNNLSNRRRRNRQTRKLQPVTVFCTPNGLTFYVNGSSKQSQASIDLPASLFSIYRIRPSTTTTTTTTDGEEGDHEDTPAGGEFCVNLTTLLECLSVVASGTKGRATLENEQHYRSSYQPPVSLTMTYHLSTELLKLELEESMGGMLCTAAIPGMMLPDDDEDGGDGMAGAFLSSPVQARILMPSVQLAVVLPELEYVAGATVAHVGIRSSGTEQQHSQQQQQQQQQNQTNGGGETRGVHNSNNSNKNNKNGGGLELGTIGHSSQCWITLLRGKLIASRARNDNEEHNVDRKGPFGGTHCDGSVHYSYPLHRFSQAMKALDIAHETCLSINRAGIMAIQHQIFLHDAPPKTSAFCDFVLVALEDEDEDVEDDDEDDVGTRIIYEEEEQEDEATAGDGTLSSSSTSHLGALSSSQSSSMPLSTSRASRPKRPARDQVVVGASGNDSDNEVNDNDDGGEDDDNDDNQSGTRQDTEASPSVVAPLFGTVVNGQSSLSSSSPSQTAEERRRQRRLRRRLSRRTDSASMSTDSPPVASPVSNDTGGVASSQQSHENRGKESQESQTQEDRNEQSRYRHPDDCRYDDDSCPSSPELVYGQQE